MHRCGHMIGRERRDLERFLRTFSVILPILVAGCATGGGTPAGGQAPDPPVELPAPLARMLADRPAPALDRVEVWVCEVPDDSTAAVYGGLGRRLELTAAGVVDALGPGLASYFASVSGGAHDLRLVAGGTVSMSADDDESDCVDAALARSAPTSDAVLAVANAEHAADQPGGRGRAGSWPTCAPGADCSAAATGRAAVIGANDLAAALDGTGPPTGPALDLVQHELGHTLGWPHSGTAVPGDDRYVSAIDLMSDSAAPRARFPDRRDGPLPLAIDLFDAGWLPLDEVEVVGADPPDGPARSVEVSLVPLDTGGGTRLAVLAVDEHRVLTLEYRRPAGHDDHLPVAGVAVHVVDDRAGTGVLRVQLPVHTDAAPFTDLLVRGDVLRRDGWRIEVLGIGPTARLAVTAPDR